MRSRQPFPRVAVLSHEELLEALFEALEVDAPQDRERLRERYCIAVEIWTRVDTPEGGPPSMSDAEVTRLATPRRRKPGHRDGPVEDPGARG